MRELASHFAEGSNVACLGRLLGAFPVTLGRDGWGVLGQLGEVLRSRNYGVVVPEVG